MDKHKLLIHRVAPGFNKVTPIGNHHLNRHHVYLLEDGEKNKRVIKIFYKANRSNREISALRLLKDSAVCIPRVIDYRCDSEKEWLVTEFCEGSVLDSIIDDIPFTDLEDIIYDCGVQLSLIHSTGDFTAYGPLNVDLSFRDNHPTYMDYLKWEVNRFLEGIDKFEHEELALIKEGKKRLYELLKDYDDKRIVPRLCHNDFDGRNILIVNDDNRYCLSKIIDFEQSIVSDSDNELLRVYDSLCNNDIRLIESFNRGYKKHMNLDMDEIKMKKRFYFLYRGLAICGWAKLVDPDHYQEGIDYIKDNV